MKRIIVTAAGLVTALAFSAPAPAGEPIPNSNASCVGFGITQFAPEQMADDVEHAIQELAAALGVPKGQVTASFAQIAGSDPGCPAGS
jgi:hypothetical protein